MWCSDSGQEWVVLRFHCKRCISEGVKACRTCSSLKKICGHLLTQLGKNGTRVLGTFCLRKSACGSIMGKKPLWRKQHMCWANAAAISVLELFRKELGQNLKKSKAQWKLTGKGATRWAITPTHLLDSRQSSSLWIGPRGPYKSRKTCSSACMWCTCRCIVEA